MVTRGAWCIRARLQCSPEWSPSSLLILRKSHADNITEGKLWVIQDVVVSSG